MLDRPEVPRHEVLMDVAANIGRLADLVLARRRVQRDCASRSSPAPKVIQLDLAITAPSLTISARTLRGSAAPRIGMS